MSKKFANTRLRSIQEEEAVKGNRFYFVRKLGWLGDVK